MSTQDAVPQPEAAGQDQTGPADTKAQHRLALADLHRKYYRGLVRYLTAQTGSRAEAEDVAQQAYGKLLALDHPETIGFLDRFLWITASRLAKDLRVQRRTRARLDVTALYETEEVAASPESDILDQQRLALVEKAIDALPPKCLEAFLLRVVEGLKIAEVASRMGVGERMAKKYVARALQFCQDYLTAAESARRKPT